MANIVEVYCPNMPTRTTPTTKKKHQLANLPNELLAQIFSNIHGQSHLAKIVLVSKQFKALVEGLLYRHISLDVQYSTGDFSNTTSFLPFERLIDRLSVRQDLARHVHRLDLRLRRRFWFDAAHSRLLKHLPELQALSLSPPPYELSIPASDWTIKSLQLDFSHVTDHYVEGRDWLRAGVPIYIIAEHIRLVKLCKLQANTVYFAPGFDDTRHLPIGSSSVVDLRFLNCLVMKSDSVLASLLRSTKYLQRFVVEFWSTTIASSPGPSAGVFELALSEHQETIEELAIATSGGLAKIKWPLGPFTQWSGLTRLVQR